MPLTAPTFDPAKRQRGVPQYLRENRLLPYATADRPTVSLSALNTPAIAGGTNTNVSGLLGVKFRAYGAQVGAIPGDTFYTGSLSTDPGNFTYGAQPWWLETVVAANSDFEINLKANGAKVRVKMDGRIASDIISIPSGGGDYYLRLTAPNDGQAHVWVVELYSGLVGYIRAVSGTRFANPTTPLGPRIVGLGDSVMEGVAGGNFAPESFFIQACQLLGFRDIFNSGVGGTGYVNPGPNGDGKKKLRDRLTTDCLNQTPDIVVMAMMGINDSDTGLYPTATLTSECQQIFSTIRTTLPAAKLVVSGPYWANGNPTTGSVDANNIMAQHAAIKAQALAAGAQWIDTLTTPWITGTGKSGSTVGDGDADFYVSSDGTHPTPDGHRYLASRFAYNLERALAVA